MDQEPEKDTTPRIPADTAERTISAIKNRYILIGKSAVKGWHAWVLIGLAVGVFGGIVLTANKFGEVEKSEASHSDTMLQRSSLVKTNAQNFINLALLYERTGRSLEHEKRKNSDVAVARKMLVEARKKPYLQRLVAKTQYNEALRDQQRAQLTALSMRSRATLGTLAHVYGPKAFGAPQGILTLTRGGSVSVWSDREMKNKVGTYRIDLSQPRIFRNSPSIPSRGIRVKPPTSTQTSSPDVSRAQSKQYPIFNSIHELIRSMSLVPVVQAEFEPIPPAPIVSTGPTCSFSFSPTTIQLGQSTLAEWTFSQGAVQMDYTCTGDVGGGSGIPITAGGGSMEIMPQESQQCGIVLRDAAGISGACVATINVQDPTIALPPDTQSPLVPGLSLAVNPDGSIVLSEDVPGGTANTNSQAGSYSVSITTEDGSVSGYTVSFDVDTVDADGNAAASTVTATVTTSYGYDNDGNQTVSITIGLPNGLPADIGLPGITGIPGGLGPNSTVTVNVTINDLDATAVSVVTLSDPNGQTVTSTVTMDSSGNVTGVSSVSSTGGTGGTGGSAGPGVGGDGGTAGGEAP